MYVTGDAALASSVISAFDFAPAVKAATTVKETASCKAKKSEPASEMKTTVKAAAKAATKKTYAKTKKTACRSRAVKKPLQKHLQNNTVCV